MTILDQITSTLREAQGADSEGFVALKKGLAYCWSVAAAASPKAGEPLMDNWLTSADRNIAWTMRENLKKNRLAKASPAWTARWQARLGIKS